MFLLHLSSYRASLHDLELASDLEAFGLVLSELVLVTAGMSTLVGVSISARSVTPEFYVMNLIFHTGKNPFIDWARIIDCGDAPLTFLDNTIALKQLEKAHKVSMSRH